MKTDYYNNIGIGISSLGLVINLTKDLSFTKAALILPLITHSELLSYLGRKTTTVLSIEKLISDRTSFFSNFNRRYQDTLILTMNSIQYLYNMEYVSIKNGVISSLNPFSYSSEMGKRVEKIDRASNNIAKILNDKVENLYLNLRIEL